jgi:molecular chaperone Hsp33
VYRPRDLVERCRCDRQRVERVLRSLTREELADCRDPDGGVVVTCEFCNRAERFSDDELNGLSPH